MVDSRAHRLPYPWSPYHYRLDGRDVILQQHQYRPHDRKYEETRSPKMGR